MKKIISLMLIFAMLFSFAGCAKLEEFFGSDKKTDDDNIIGDSSILTDELSSRIPGVYNFLVVREESTAGDAGAFMLAQINFSEKALSLFHIPENLFVVSENANSLGEIYEKEYKRVSSLGLTLNECELSGAKAVSTCITEIFCLPVDYHIVLNRAAVATCVDILGGIEINIPFTFTTSSGHTYTEGVKMLDGNSVFDFVNYDFFDSEQSKLNAASEALAYFHKKLVSVISSETISLYMVQAKPHLSTDLPAKDGCDISFLRKLISVSPENWQAANLCTAPASTSNGSYEVVRYSAAYEQISSFFNLSYDKIKSNSDSNITEEDLVFDRDEKLCDASQMIVNAIYKSSTAAPAAYTADQIYAGRLEIYQK